MAASDFVGFVALLLAAFLPPLFFAVRLRNAERHRREPWQGLAKAFLWGAFVATLLAFLLETALFPLVGEPDAEPLVPEAAPALLLGALSVSAVLLAPVLEEGAKALGMRFVHDDDPEPEDGAIYGAMIGLGFAGTETALYVMLAYALTGLEGALMTAAVRGLATAALHGAASALSGHGYWEARYRGVGAAFPRALVVAMLVHGAYNWLAGIDSLLALAGAVLLALTVWMWVRRRVQRLDRLGAPGVLDGIRLGP